MMERQKKVKLPVEVDDEYGFSIDEERLDESLKRRLEELAEEKANRPNTALRKLLAAVLGTFFLGFLTVLVLRGIVFWACILFLAAVVNLDSIVKFIEGRE